MSPKPTPEALHKMGLEYGDNGLIQKIGIKVHPDVQAAEDAATNKPKHIDQVEGYVDEPYQEDFNQEPLVIKFDGAVNGDEWAKKNEMAIADLVGAIESKIGPATEQSESNVSGLLNKNMTVLFNVNHESGFNSELVKAGPINYGPTTGFDIETEPAADSFQSALAFGKQEPVKPAKRTVKPKGSKSTTLKKKKDVDEDFFEEIADPTPLPNFTAIAGTQRCFIGIDNGVSGSIGIFFDNGTYHFTKTPTRNELNYTKVKSKITRIKTVELKKILSLGGPGTMVMIERPMVNPQRFKATVSALRAYEATITILETLNLPYEVCDSKEWQKAFLPSGVSGDDLKPASLNVGNRLFPLFKEHTHSDRDGLLIAAFCKQKHK